MIRMFLLVFCVIGLQQDEAVLSWNETYKLSWADFKGKPNLNVSAVAITASGISFGFSITKTEDNIVTNYRSNVHAYFYPEQSWVKINETDDQVLKHEQLHFDITELFARKLRQRISNLKGSNNVSAELKKAHNNTLNELSDFQDQYDNETDFSRHTESQIKWTKHVNEELIKLSEFKSYN